VPSLRPLVALLAACLAVLAAAPVAHAGVGHTRVAIDGTATFPDYAQTAHRHDVVILQAWQTDRLRALKAANPHVRVLMYKNLSSTKASNVDGIYATGVGLQEVEEHHPEWLLLNTEGERIVFRGYPNLYAVDVGDADYQRRWADAVLRELAAAPWDGVFIDDANPTMRHHYEVARVAAYPTDAQYGAATERALAHIGPRIRATGRLAIANIGAWSDYRATASRFLDHLDGAMDEQFVKWGNDPATGYVSERQWANQLDEVVETTSRGKLFIGVTHSLDDDERAAAYGRVSLMLAGTPRASYAFGASYSREPWHSVFDEDLGAPAGPLVHDPGGLRHRRFAEGLAAVNPTLEPRVLAVPAELRRCGHPATLTLGSRTARVVRGCGEAATETGAAETAGPAEPPAPPLTTTATAATTTTGASTTVAGRVGGGGEPAAYRAPAHAPALPAPIAIAIGGEVALPAATPAAPAGAQARITARGIDVTMRVGAPRGRTATVVARVAGGRRGRRARVVARGVAVSAGPGTPVRTTLRLTRQGRRIAAGRRSLRVTLTVAGERRGRPVTLRLLVRR
jgi:hypothetical protein